MRKFAFVVFITLIFLSSSYSQELSSFGRAHFKAAMALFEIASSVSDYEAVAKEFELVTESDSTYADTYINLCKIYGRIGVEKGEIYFSKATNALTKYHNLKPNDEVTYSDEMIVLNALKNKRASEMYKRFVGAYTWNGGLTISYRNGQYYASLINNGNNPNSTEFVTKIERHGDYLLLYTTEITDGYENGELSGGYEYYITKENNREIHYTREYDYNKYKITYIDEAVYIVLDSYSREYFYKGRKICTIDEQYLFLPAIELKQN